jgi:TonB family protein
MRPAIASRTMVRLSASLLFAAALSPAAAQIPKPLAPDAPLPKGQQMEAKDGDTVVIRGDARVRIIHRSDASVRAIFNSAERWLVVIADFADATTGAPDGFVDSTLSFHELDGVWPLGERWQGTARIDDYAMAYTPGGSYGITTEGAIIQLFSGSGASNTRWFADPRAVTLSYRGGGRTNSVPGASRLTFDQAEERAIAEATRNARRGDGPMTTTTDGPGGTRMTSRVGITAPPKPVGAVDTSEAPVRVGSTIAQPTKTVDAKPIVPAAAQVANVRGVVIVEVVVGRDGVVTDARILRSIPLLDQAALDTVRQWRYTPTLINGQPVSVIMTVAVPFP